MMYGTDDWPAFPLMSALVNRVHCMDALELLRMLPDASVDAVITDPPYGLAGRVFEIDGSMRGKDERRGNYSAVNEAWDTVAPISWMAECSRILKAGGSVVCFGVRQSIYTFAAEGLRLGWRIVNDITWEKPDPPPCFTGRMMTEATERILWFCPSGENWTYNLDVARTMGGGVNLRDVWLFGVERGDYRFHPTQKPLQLLERIVRILTPVDGLIVDPFAGSGTTAIAARNWGRSFIVSDISPDYAAIARERLRLPFEERHVTVESKVDDLPLFAKAAGE